SGNVPVPFFAAPLVDRSLQWPALIFEHAAVGNIEIHRAKMNLVNGPTNETRQTEVDAPWAEKIKQLYPLKINRFAVHDGEIHYRDYTREPSVDLPFDRVQMVGTNFTNSKKLSKELDRRHSNRRAALAGGRRALADLARSLRESADVRVQPGTERVAAGETK